MQMVVLHTFNIPPTLSWMRLQELPNLCQVLRRQLHSSGIQIFQGALYVSAACARVNDDQEKQKAETGRKSYTHEDPGSGMTWSPRAPTQAMLSWATVIPLRFAMVVRVSTSLRLWFIFFVRGSRMRQPERAARIERETHFILETAIFAPEITFFEV